ncbi:hypothetical protein [Desulfurobacterium sp.]
MTLIKRAITLLIFVITLVTVFAIYIDERHYLKFYVANIESADEIVEIIESVCE